MTERRLDSVVVRNGMNLVEFGSWIAFGHADFLEVAYSVPRNSEFTLADLMVETYSASAPMTVMNRLIRLGMVVPQPRNPHERRWFWHEDHPLWFFIDQTWELLENVEQGTAKAFLPPRRRQRLPWIELSSLAEVVGRPLCGTPTRFRLLIWLSSVKGEGLSWWPFSEETGDPLTEQSRLPYFGDLIRQGLLVQPIRGSSLWVVERTRSPLLHIGTLLQKVALQMLEMSPEAWV